MATISFSFTPEGGYTGGYRVKFFKASDLVTVFNQQDFASPTSPQTVTTTITDFVNYVAKVYATGCSYKLVATVNIPSPLVCSAPTSIARDTITTTSVHVTWGNPVSILPAQYYWEILASGSVVQSGYIGTNSKSITSLTTATLYTINVYANCQPGVLSSPATTTFTTA